MLNVTEQITELINFKTMESVWQREDLRLIVYPRVNLVVCRGLLMRYRELNTEFMDSHGLRPFERIRILPVQRTLYPDETFLALLADRWNYAGTVHGVGLQCVRRVQRWLRTLKLQTLAVAFMMGQHPRVGARSPLMLLNADLLRMTVGMLL